MTHLNIQQGQNIEVVSTNLIQKLYEAALSVPEPLEGEQDAAYMSGNLQVDKSYRSQVEYLTNRFDDLHINVTAGYYMLFHDSAVNDVLKNTIGDGTGVLIEEFQSITNDSQLGLGPSDTAHPEITDFREGCLLTGLAQFNNGIPALTGLTVFGFPPNVTNFSNVFASGLHFDGIVVKNWNNFINRQENSSWWKNGYYVYDMDSNGNLTRIDTLTLPSNVTFPNDIQWKNHLSGIKLEELVIPAGITRFGLAAGNGIKKISFEPNSTLTTIDFGFYLNDNISSSIVQLDVANLPQTITTIGNNAFRSCSNVTGVLDLPNLTSLGQYSFYSTGITSIADLGSITSVSGMCFNNCDSLTTVTLPNSCTSIDSGAFAFCDALTSIDLGGVTTIANQAFIADPALTTVTGTSNLTSIGNNAFQSCTSLSSIDFTGSRFTSVPQNAFPGCTSLTSVTLPSTCKTIAGQAFDGCTTLTSINLDNIESISAFYAFRNTGITDYVLPNIKNLGAKNLSGCHNAYLLDCGSNLTTIASDALWDSGFSIFIFRGTTPPSFSGTSFEYNMTGRIIYVPDAAVTDYQTAWPNMASYITGLSNYNPS